MKTLCLSLLNLFIILQVNLTAQSWQYCNPYSPSTPYEGIFIGDSLFLVNICDDGLGTEGCHLRAFDLEGNLKWETPGGQTYAITDSTIYVVAFDPEEGGHDCYIVANIVQLNFKGEILAEFRDNCGGFIFDNPLSLDVSSTGELLVCNQYATVSFDISASNYNEIHEQDDTNILGAYYLENLTLEDTAIAQLFPGKIEYMDADFNTLGSCSLSFEIEKFDILDDTLYILSENNIYRMKDFSNVIEDTISFNESTEVLSFYILDEKIWVRLVQDEVEYLQTIERRDTEIKNSIPVETQYLSINHHYYIKDNRWYLTGETGYHQAAILSYPLDSIPEFTHPDIAISRITPYNIRYYLPDPVAPLEYADVYFDLKFTIKNTGSFGINTVSFFTLLLYTTSFGGDIMDTYHKYYWTENDLDLAPGDSTVLFKYELNKQGDYWSVCLSALAPNYQVETDYTDNRSCANFLSMLELESIEKGKEAIIYPNPVREKLFIEFNTSVSRSLILYNSIGVPVFSVATNKIKAVLPMDSLTEGFYFLLITEPTKRYTKIIEVQ